LLVGHTERLAVTVLEVDSAQQVGIDAVEVQGVDRKSAFVGLARARDHAEGERMWVGLVHGVSLGRR
jgi:hypothetical protein